MPNAAATNSATPPTTTRTLHPNRLTDTSCCDHRQNPPIVYRYGPEDEDPPVPRIDGFGVCGNDGWETGEAGTLTEHDPPRVETGGHRSERCFIRLLQVT